MEAAPHADVVVSDDVEVVAAARGPAVLVSLPMLSRGHPTTPSGAVDEARELATYGDVFDPWEEADPDAVALLVGAEAVSYSTLGVPEPAWGDRPRVLVGGGLDRVLRQALAAWTADGSVVLVHGTDAKGGDPAGRLASEGVTVDARA